MFSNNYRTKLPEDYVTLQDLSKELGIIHTTLGKRCRKLGIGRKMFFPPNITRIVVHRDHIPAILSIGTYVDPITKEEIDTSNLKTMAQAAEEIGIPVLYFRNAARHYGVGKVYKPYLGQYTKFVSDAEIQIVLEKYKSGRKTYEKGMEGLRKYAEKDKARRDRRKAKLDIVAGYVLDEIGQIMKLSREDILKQRGDKKRKLALHLVVRILESQNIEPTEIAYCVERSRGGIYHILTKPQGVEFTRTKEIILSRLAQKYGKQRKEA